MSLGSDDVKRVDEPACDLCVVCHDELDDKDPHRTLVKLKRCGHQFHLDCIGSEFNSKNRMICPTCRNVEQGRWLFARQQNEDPNDPIEIEEEQYDDLDDFIMITDDESPNQGINTLVLMGQERQNYLRLNSSLPFTGGLTHAPVWGQPHNPARSTSSFRFSVDDTLRRQEIQQQIELSLARVRAANEQLSDFYSSTRRQESYLPDDWMERLMARNHPADNEQNTNRMMYGFDMRGSNNVEGGRNSHESLGFRSEPSLAYTRQQESYLDDDWIERIMERNLPDNEPNPNHMMYGFDMRGSNDIEDGSNSHESLGFRNESSLAYTSQQVLQRWTDRSRAANEQHMNRTMYDFAMRRINDIENGRNGHESWVFRSETSLDYTPQEQTQQQTERTSARTHAADEDPTTRMMYGFNMRRNNGGDGSGSSRGPWQG